MEELDRGMNGAGWALVVGAILRGDWRGVDPKRKGDWLAFVEGIARNDVGGVLGDAAQELTVWVREVARSVEHDWCGMWGACGSVAGF